MSKKKEVDPTAPGGDEFDIDHANAEDFAAHEEILRRRQSVAALTAYSSPPAGPNAAPGAPPVASFSAPSAPLLPFYNSDTQQVVHLPQALYDQLSNKDRAKLTSQVDKPEKLPTV